jgi:hypothetical protein
MGVTDLDLAFRAVLAPVRRRLGRKRGQQGAEKEK